jgi:predicted transcriptional regulator
MKMLVDLEDWKYHLEHPDAPVKQGKTIITDKLTIGKLEMELLNFIKNEKPQSIRELARMIHKDIRTVHPKVKELEKEGLIEFKKGPKNKKIPVMSYDKIEIAV